MGCVPKIGSSAVYASTSSTVLAADGTKLKSAPPLLFVVVLPASSTPTT